MKLDRLVNLTEGDICLESCFQDVDVIPLKIPSDKDHQVHVGGLRWDGTQEDLEVSEQLTYLVLVNHH